MRVILPLASALLVYMAWRSYGWGGVALAAGGIVMWLLLHFTRMMQLLRRAANRPVGYVDSAVVLQSRLHRGQTLLQVIGLARALGALQGEKDAQPEVYRWADNSGSHVEAWFAEGRLQRWELVRPTPDPAP